MGALVLNASAAAVVAALVRALYRMLERYSPTDKQVERGRRRKVMALSDEWQPVTFECEECERLYEVLVNAAYYPLHDRYDPCPECGHVTVVPTKEER